MTIVNSTNPSHATPLPGLLGDNPLGFLAALGVQVALAHQGAAHKMHWTDGAIPHPVLTPAVGLDEIAVSFRKIADDWLDGPAIGEEVNPKLKYMPGQIRNYLEAGRSAETAGVLAACLLAEGSLDNGGKAKPTDFYFTAGQQKFVAIARENLKEVTEEQLLEDMGSSWSYSNEDSTLMWDRVADRNYALSHADPTNSTLNPKFTNPGAEALAIIGLSQFPCFASRDGTATVGCSGGWKSGFFTWPLWMEPASLLSVKGLLCQVEDPNSHSRRTEWYKSWGISRVLQSQIRRSDQGGYGTFGPPKSVWQRD